MHHSHINFLLRHFLQLYEWLGIFGLLEVVVIVGIEGYRQFPTARQIMIVGTGGAMICIVFAVWLQLHHYLTLVVNSCLLAVGIVWKCYKVAEAKELRVARTELNGPLTDGA